MSKAKAIPTAARKAVRERDLERCVRCSSADAHDIHHRMRRRDGGHALSNMVLLCRFDHEWVHANPAKAREHGFIVSAWGDVLDSPIKSFRGWVVLDNEGGLSRVDAPPVVSA